MVEISASMVKELREKSGAAMMDCKKALVETSGDFDKAFEWLRQKGVGVASKKASRVASEGLVVGQVSADGKTGVLVEVNCETDFVARNDEFVALTKKVSDLALKLKPATLEALLQAKDGGASFQEVLTETISKTGENIVVRRYAVLDVGPKNGVVGLYVHSLGGKMGALVEIESNKPVDAEKVSGLAKEIAMHIVSYKPQFLTRADVPSEVVENERRIESGKADLADKKPEIREKIVTGRVDKLFAERCLSDQPFVKDQAQTVAKVIQQKGQELGVELKPTGFALFILGEGSQTNGSGPA
jgi:elongation factor Ts